jgi:SAM-dependent methyltransferase
MDAQFWEDRYRSRDQVFSGAPNGVLVAEVTGLSPGRALDVGCGEGADALWLARHGWQVTAVDISPTALQRATDADSHNRATWLLGDLTATAPQAAAFDLVSVQYFPLRRQAEHTALHGLLNAVVSGGIFLFASHDPADLSPNPAEGFDPSDYYQPDDIAQLLDSDWTVQVNAARPRTAPAPAGTHHTHDTVLRARRR